MYFISIKLKLCPSRGNIFRIVVVIKFAEIGTKKIRIVVVIKFAKIGKKTK